MWAMFLAVGAIGFWILVAVVFILLLIEIEYERPGLATLTFIVFFLALWLFGDFNIIETVLSAPLLSLACAAGYVVVGFGWSFGKWIFFCWSHARKYNEAKAKFLKKHGVEGDRIPDNLLRDWQRRSPGAHYNGYSESNNPTPKAGKNKGRILTWAIYWPWSALWTLINDPVKRLFKEIFHQLKAAYQRIADSAFKGVDDDFRKAPPEDGEVAPAEDDDF